MLFCVLCAPPGASTAEPPFVALRRPPHGLPAEVAYGGSLYKRVDWQQSVLLNIAMHSRFRLTVAVTRCVPCRDLATTTWRLSRLGQLPCCDQTLSLFQRIALCCCALVVVLIMNVAVVRCTNKRAPCVHFLQRRDLSAPCVQRRDRRRGGRAAARCHWSRTRRRRLLLCEARLAPPRQGGGRP